MNAELQKTLDGLLSEREYYKNLPLDEFMKYANMANSWSYDALDDVDMVHVLAYRGLSKCNYESFKRRKIESIDAYIECLKEEDQEDNDEHCEGKYESEWARDINYLSESEFLKKWEGRSTTRVLTFS